MEKAGTKLGLSWELNVIVIIEVQTKQPKACELGLKNFFNKTTV